MTTKRGAQVRIGDTLAFTSGQQIYVEATGERYTHAGLGQTCRVVRDARTAIEFLIFDTETVNVVAAEPVRVSA